MLGLFRGHTLTDGLHASKTVQITRFSKRTIRQNGCFYRRPLPRPRPRPLPAEADLGTTDFLGASSTNKASKFKLSGSNQDRIVEPRTESVV
jgi:hypothetical protein